MSTTKTKVRVILTNTLQILALSSVQSFMRVTICSGSIYQLKFINVDFEFVEKQVSWCSAHPNVDYLDLIVFSPREIKIFSQ